MIFIERSTSVQKDNIISCIPNTFLFIPFQDRIVHISDLVGPNFHFLWTIPSSAHILEHSKNEHAAGIVQDIIELVEKMKVEEYTEGTVSKMFKGYKRPGVRYKGVMKLMRAVLCGLKVGFQCI